MRKGKINVAGCSARDVGSTQGISQIPEEINKMLEEDAKIRWCHVARYLASRHRILESRDPKPSEPSHYAYGGPSSSPSSPSPFIITIIFFTSFTEPKLLLLSTPLQLSLLCLIVGSQLRQRGLKTRLSGTEDSLGLCFQLGIEF
ncbi:unnamed protein product [Prunus armeniaca]|uniref:Uncharacterized protein n=1 Tax=Prunus armeniaca TaxID=36596 RepID=A0A6J5TFN1_PRUAR|nr:hypothetical protein GBA52_004828 [Prunus armeniaca]CAB4262242.1 unnamed protein product [Prunus armeniaca]CAB4292928.1 unnamed protein product [Prunus armeniaca]